MSDDDDERTNGRTDERTDSSRLGNRRRPVRRPHGPSSPSASARRPAPPARVRPAWILRVVIDWRRRLRKTKKKKSKIGRGQARSTTRRGTHRPRTKSTSHRGVEGVEPKGRGSFAQYFFSLRETRTRTFAERTNERTRKARWWVLASRTN